ncbi:YqhG family protein [Halobacillus salinarum]|uniref:YqhG family protein n=1 Tax=Halobacillus salinarum TaxID=2932257 RepID=A0ABY4EDL8_9BACI|nr:YqhG family protein [Halobacillus salinarum]UOQ42540.1 YqhG family protein [Halobacillus salinarum]
MKENPYYEFVKHFFLSYGCSIVEQSPFHMTIQLTAEVDEELMNRPFYWHYMKKMNRQGEPMQLTFTHTDAADQEGIFLHPGSPTLHRIYRMAVDKGRTTRLYETIEQPIEQKAMTPWLILNIQLQYRGKQTKNEQLSIGLNLINGGILENVMDKVWNVTFEPKVSDYTFPMTPIISLESGYRRMENYIENYVAGQDDAWVNESEAQLREELHLLKQFVLEENMTDEDYYKEKEQIETRYKPRISLSIVNGGLFYISQQTSNQLVANS